MTKGGLQVGGNYRGAWDSDTQYSAHDLVTSGGALYSSNVDHVSGTSFDSNLWTAISAGGGTLAGVFKPESYGAVGDGTTDDTTAIQSAINAAQAVKGRVVLDTKTYAFTHLTITGSCSIYGNGVFGVYDTFASGVGNFTPTLAPWLTGSVLKCTATAQAEAILINGESQNVDLKDFGLLFANLFASTGHGISANPGTGKNGLASPNWDNVQVFGHDGNSYGFYMLNAAMGTFNHLRSWGGGWVKFENSGGSQYGNSTFLGGNNKLFVGGSAHCCHLLGVWTRVGFVGCEFNAHNLKSAYASRPAFAGIAAAPSASQRLFVSDNNLRGLSFVSSAWDVGSSSVAVPQLGAAQANGGIFIDPGSFFSAGQPPENWPAPMIAAPTGSSNFDMPHAGDVWLNSTASFTFTAATLFRNRTVDATAGAIVATLPAANACKGKQYTLVKIDASVNTVTFQRAGTDLINGAATLVLASQWDHATVESDGTRFVRVA